MPDEPRPRGLLTRTSLRDQAVDVLRDMIVRGELPAGDRLNEVELAATLGTSRGPLREAIQRLNAEGLVEMRQNRGAFVRSSSDEDIRDMLVVREVLEVKAAMLAARHATDDEIKDLRQLLRDMGDVVKSGTTPATELDFHQRILELSKNRYLHRAGSDLQVQIRTARQGSPGTPARAKQTHEEHRAVVKAIAGHDEEAAAAAMARHLGMAAQQLPSADSQETARTR